ncbi:MAG TPA: rhodanese-like domain-containing protein [Ramlibacter sp.]|uniref:sulfurtransferase n=1 Tax=Ramlibacter sp. TaxID=1917967 RepID=UPI002D7F7996|nr:rhodanese-like domain-containing protein [Ramlibacter sp.]HET8748938.1 rhodanese-like domain-containing protein [Ramlibacter sp.]
MKKILAFAVCLAGAGAAFAAQPLLAPTELKAQLGSAELRVIDIRDAKSFADAHIPGALNAPYGKWRGPASNPGELPPVGQLTELVRSLGLTPATHAVVVSSGSDATDFGAAARVYWTLKYLGLKELSLLNGGVKAWSDAKLPQDKSVAQVAPSNYTPQPDTSLIATREEVLQGMNGHSTVLVDSRPKDFFLGDSRHPASKVPGTLQGAINVEYSRFFADEKSGILRPEKVREAASAVDPKKDTVAFCNTGHWAATDWFAMHEILGMKHVKLYPGSMVDWTQDARALPMSNVPNRAKQLLIDAKMWAGKK